MRAQRRCSSRIAYSWLRVAQVRLLAITAVVAGTALSGCAGDELPATVTDRPLWIVSTTSLATVLTYCRTKHGKHAREHVQTCFYRARDLLSKDEFAERAKALNDKCAATASFNTCVTPEIGQIASDLVERFENEGL